MPLRQRSAHARFTCGNAEHEEAFVEDLSEARIDPQQISRYEVGREALERQPPNSSPVSQTKPAIA